jgi:hypothetical protein
MYAGWKQYQKLLTRFPELEEFLCGAERRFEPATNGDVSKEPLSFCYGIKSLVP